MLDKELVQQFDLPSDLTSVFNTLVTVENQQVADVLENADNEAAADLDLQNLRHILIENEEVNNMVIAPRNAINIAQEMQEMQNARQDVDSTNFQYIVDSNGRIEGQFLNDKVINLSKRALSESEISVLSKGLKFVMTPKELDYSQIKVDLESFGRRLRLKWHFRESEDFSN